MFLKKKVKMSNLNSFYLLILFFVINLICVIFIDKIKKCINILDRPDGIRKLQIEPVAPIGGFLIFFNIFILFFLSFFNENLSIFDRIFFEINQQPYLRAYFSFFVTTLFFFIIGLYDDNKNMSPSTKTVILLFICFCTILIDETLIIQNLNFNSFENEIRLNNFSYIFTVLCILFLVNAFNLYDGINLQSGIYFVIIYFYFFTKNIFPHLAVIFIISNLFFLYLNFKNKIYYGDNGIYINSYIISYFIIKSYNYDLEGAPKFDEILLLFLLPSIEVFRLFITRVIHLKNPFLGDRDHLHHLLLDKFKNLNLVNFILLLLILTPILVFNYNGQFLLEIIIFFTSIYLTMIIYLKYRS